MAIFENINYHDLSRDELVVGVDNYSTKIAHKLNQESNISIHDVESYLAFIIATLSKSTAIVAFHSLFKPL